MGVKPVRIKKAASGAPNLLTFILVTLLCMTSLVSISQLSNQIGAQKGLNTNPFTLHSASASSSIPTDVQDYVQITLSNSQGSSVSSGTPIRIPISMADYIAYLNEKATNVVFFDSSWQQLPAWLENNYGCRTCTQTFWVNIDSSISSYGSITIYLAFLTSTKDGYCGPYCDQGAYPTATSSYGQYDNGPLVFTYYTSFAGTSMPTLWTTEVGSPSVNNGLTISADQLVTKTNGWFSLYGYALEADLSSITTHSSGDHGGFGLIQDSSGNPYTACGSSTVWVQIASGSGCTYYALANQFSTSSDLAVLAVDWPNGYSGGSTASESTGIWSLMGSTSSVATYIGYSSVSSTTSYLPPARDDYYISMGASSGGPTIKYQWVRVRELPPNNVMPSSTFSAVTKLRNSQIMPFQLWTDVSGNLTKYSSDFSIISPYPAGYCGNNNDVFGFDMGSTSNFLIGSCTQQMTINGNAETWNITNYDDWLLSQNFIVEPGIQMQSASGDCQSLINLITNSSDAENTFVSNAVNYANSEGLMGYQVDFEPQCSQLTSGAYATQMTNFLNYFGNQLHQHGMWITVTMYLCQNSQNIGYCGSGSGLDEFDFTNIASSSGVDSFMIQDYSSCYNTGWTCFTEIETDMSSSSGFNIAQQKIGIGLESAACNTGSNCIAGSAVNDIIGNNTILMSVWPASTSPPEFLNATGIVPSSDTWYTLFQQYEQSG
jgi:hypothetical protein